MQSSKDGFEDGGDDGDEFALLLDELLCFLKVSLQEHLATASSGDGLGKEPQRRLALLTTCSESPVFRHHR